MTRRRVSPWQVLHSIFAPLFIATLLVCPARATTSSLPSPAEELHDPEIVCSPSDPSDCYPKVFVPTDWFQVIREGQDIPSGLHIRLNVHTGEKEAKLYDSDEKIDSSLEGLPVDGAVMVVTQEGTPQEDAKIPPNAPKYDPVGKIKEPEDPGSKDDHATFSVSMMELHRMGRNGLIPEELFVKNLIELEELAHDIYFGLQIAQDVDAIKSLLCLMTPETQSSEPLLTEAERLAAAIIGAATQNNPSAVEQISKNWAVLARSKCYGKPSSNILTDKFYQSVVTSDPRTTRAKIAALNGLVKDETIKKEFLKSGGMSKLLGVITQDNGNRNWEGAKTKIGHFVLDNFLDEEMGATMGIWPPTTNLETRDSNCAQAEHRLEDGCWAFHLRPIAENYEIGDGHWSQEVYEKLTGKIVGWRKREEL